MKDTQCIFAELDEVIAALRDIMTALNGGSPDDLAVTTGLERMRAASAQIGDPAALKALLPESEHARLRDKLEDWMRLNALTTSLCARDRERLEERFERARDGRRSLVALRPADDSSGRSCDLSA